MISLLSVPAFAEDCLEIAFEVEPELQVGVVYFFYGEITNCGDEAGEVFFDVTIETGEMSYEMPQFSIYMAAGQTIARSFAFVVPPIIPEGDVTICVTATLGEATASECIYLTVTHPGNAPEGKGPGNSHRLEHAPRSNSNN
jgi:hypothetical protein